MSSSHPQLAPTTASLRMLLSKVLGADSDLDAFCLDHFPEVARQFSNGMDRTVKVNLLLVKADRGDVLELLRGYHPRTVARHEALLQFEEDPAPGSATPSKAIRPRHAAPSVTSAVLRGLLPFEEGDPLVARDTDVQAVYTLVRSQGFRFGVIWGQSGCGKTSMLRAGLIPTLQRNGLRAIYFPKPTADPAALLDAQLADVSTNAAAAGFPIIVIVDQFEEFFLLNPTSESVEPFRRWLTGRMQDTGAGAIALLIGIRDDFFVRLLHLAPAVPDPTSSRLSYELENLRAAQAREVIDASIKADHVRFEAALVQSLISDLSSAGRVRVAELQLVASELKRKRITTQQEYSSLGGARGALSSYVRDELRRARHEYISRAILKAMCSPGGQTRSPVDLTLEQLAVAARTQVRDAPALDQQIDDALDQLIAARIVIQTEQNKYNLTHDLFAVLVHTAIAGTETPAERANRIFARYLADYRMDRGVRVPLRHLPTILRNASTELRSSSEGRSLLRRTLVMPLVNLGLLLALLLGVPYSILATSYYVSTAPSSFKGPPFIVIRTGHPHLKFLPGFDEVLFDTGFSMRDVSPDGDGAYLFAGDVLSGFRTQTLDAQPKWMRQVSTRLDPAVQVKISRLLNEPDAAITTAVQSFKQDYVDWRAVRALMLVGRADPSRVSAAPLETLRKLAAEASTAAPESEGASWAHASYTALAENGVRMPGGPPLTVQVLLQRMHKVMELPWEKQPYWRMSSVLSALITLAHSAPETISQSEIKAVQDLLRKNHSKITSEENGSRVLLAFAASNPTLGAELLKSLAQDVADELQEAEKKKGSDMMPAVLILALDNPLAVTADSVAPLTNLLAQPNPPKGYLRLAVPLSLLAQANPSAFTAQPAERLKTILLDPSTSEKERDVCAVALTRLGAAHPAWKSEAARNRAFELVRRSSEMDAIHAASALADALRAEGTPGPAVRALLEKVGGIDVDALRTGPIEVDSFQSVLRRLSRLQPAAVSADLIRALSNALGKTTMSDHDFLITYGLLALAPSAPSAVLAQRSLFNALRGRGLDPEESTSELHGVVLAVLARAAYEEQRQRDPARLIERLMDQLQDVRDRDARASGAFGIYLLALDDPAAPPRELLRRLFAASEPPVRMAAGEALELLTIADLYHQARRKDAGRALARSRLRWFSSTGEHHVRLAAALALDELH